MRTVVVALACTLVAWPSWAAEQGPKTDFSVRAVLLLLGVGDRTPVKWDGEAKLTAGEIRRVEPWRFRPDDEIVGQSGWKTSSHVLQRPSRGRVRMSPTGVVLTLAAPDRAKLLVTTAQGNFEVALSDLRPGRPVSALGGRVRVEEVAPSWRLTAGPTENDYPAAAVGPDGRVWVVFVQHTPRGPVALQPLHERPRDFKQFEPTGGGDQIAVLCFDGTRWSRPTPVTPPERDVWRPGIAVDGQGRLHVVWTEKRGDNWDLYGKAIDPGQLARAVAQQDVRLTTDPGPDVGPVLTTDRAGQVWVAWQAWREGQADILLLRLDEAGRPSGEPLRVTDSPADEWSPALAADARGRVHVAYDTYAAGNYDVYLRTFDQGRLGPPVAVAASPRFEASPSLACDQQGRVWVAYEQRSDQWGKDTGPLAAVQGAPLYLNGASVQVRVVDNGQLLRPSADVLAALPESLRSLNSYPRLGFDGDGRLWLVFRHRHEAVWGGNPAHLMVGAVWLEYAVSLDRDGWTEPVFLTCSDNLLDVRPALARERSGRLLAVYPSDGRLRHEVLGNEEQRKVFFTSAGVSVPGQVRNDLFAAVLPQLGPVPAVRLTPVRPDTPGSDGPPPFRWRGSSNPAGAEGVHPRFAEAVQRLRQARIQVGGKTYLILRGEFHRHTEMSADGGNDGSLEDMWRYALDAASLDWIGNGDHDNGGGREYPWWIIQKTTDLYTVPGRFTPMYCYERSVPYPNGHRNAMFARRGIRTLPRLLGDEPGGVSPDDTKMFYDYLKQLGGICASHTSGTGMGTDWRDNNPLVEPVVEIYQGDRNSYEALGAPRVAYNRATALGGWRPFGMVWNALALGYRLGFQSSSDHWSTHISYAMVLAEKRSREAILDAFRKRHCYAATDDILLDVRMGDHLMGDVFTHDGNSPLRLSVRVHGTAPIERIDVIKNFRYVYSVQPGKEAVTFTWTDLDAQPGTSWYYVRVLQSDTQLAWSSPIWVRVRGRR